MANSKRVGPSSGKSAGTPATISKKRERRSVSHTSPAGSLTVFRGKLHHVTRWIYIALGVVMVLGFGLVSVPNMRTDTQGTGSVACVNRHAVEREPFEAQVRQMAESPYSFGASGPTQELSMRNMVLDQQIDHYLKLDAARDEGNKVGRKQLQERIDQAIESIIQQQKSYFKTDKDFKEKYLAKRMKVKDEAELRKKLRGDISPEWVKATREQILIENLERKIRNQAGKRPLTGVKPEDTEIHARQILIKTDKRKDPEARKLAQGILDQINAGADFVKLAKQKSEDDGTKAQGGDMGWTGKGMFYQGEEIEKAAFATKPGKTSGLLKTRMGYVILKVEGQRYSATKQWNEYTEGLKKKGKIDVQDPVLVAYREMNAEAKTDADRKKNRQKALGLFQKALEKVYAAETRAAINYTIGSIYSQDNDTAKAAEAYGQAARDMPAPDIYMALGDAQKKLKKSAAAIESYKLASDMANDKSSQSHYFTHMMLQSAFGELGQPQLAAKEKVWIDEYMKAQQSGGGGMGGFPGGTFSIPPR